MVVDDRKMHVVDFGGTKIEYLGGGLSIQHESSPMPKTGDMKKDLELIQQFLQKFIIAESSQVIISFPGMLDKKGYLQKWPNRIYWKDLDFKNFIKNCLNSDNVVIDDDANFGIHFTRHIFQSPVRNALYINVGTGIGMGMLINNKIYRGDNGFAGELGHISVNDNDDRCNCGNTSCLQLYASGSGLRFQMSRLNLPDDLSLNELAARYIDNIDVQTTIANGAVLLSSTIKKLATVLDINHIHFAGGVLLCKIYMATLQKYLNKIKIELQRPIQFEFTPTINPSIIGAILYGLNYEKMLNPQKHEVEQWISQHFKYTFSRDRSYA